MLADQLLDRFRPDIVLTYGGHPANLELMKRAKNLGVPVVFHLHNFAYRDRRAFEHCAAVVTPSEYSKRFFQERLGVESTTIPYPIRPDRVVVPEADRTPRYVTFVNPERTKGATVLARIAYELGRRRPDIPLLVVEGRSQARELGD